MTNNNQEDKLMKTVDQIENDLSITKKQRIIRGFQLFLFLCVSFAILYFPNELGIDPDNRLKIVGVAAMVMLGIPTVIQFGGIQLFDKTSPKAKTQSIVRLLAYLIFVTSSLWTGVKALEVGVYHEYYYLVLIIQIILFCFMVFVGLRGAKENKTKQEYIRLFAWGGASLLIIFLGFYIQTAQF